jgi:iron complex transport system ATP-binding protein
MLKDNNIHVALKDLSIGYDRNKVVVQNISVEFASGNLIGLVANNGVGKSTLLKTLSGNLNPISGKITIGEIDITSIPHIELAKRIAIVLTEKPQLAGFTVYDLVALGRFPHTNMFGSLTEHDKAVINSSISLCGINALQDKRCNELSDGEFQKAMIARALAQQTDVLLLDEPTAFLDYSSKRKLFTLLKDIAEKENKIVLVSSHDIEILTEFAHAVYLIQDKTKHQLISSAEFKKTPLAQLLEE